MNKKGGPAGSMGLAMNEKMTQIINLIHGFRFVQI